MPEPAKVEAILQFPQDRQVCPAVVSGHGQLSARLLSQCVIMFNKIAGRLEPRRPPMTDEGTETAFFRLDQRKHFRKSKHLLRSEVN